MRLADEGSQRRKFIYTAGQLAAFAALLIAGFFTASVRAQLCAVSTNYATVVPLIPAAVPNLKWAWNSQSSTPIEETGCSAIYGNLWGVASATGQVTMATTPALVTSANLKQIVPTSDIVAYPEILYGYKPFGGYTTNQSNALVFPMAVNKIPNLWLMTSYSSVIADSGLPMDFAYDLWMTQSYQPTTVRRGDIELMIWLYHQGLVPSGTLLPQQTLTTPMWINGVLQQATFDVYAAMPNLPKHTSELVTFVLRQGSVAGGAKGGLQSGTVGFNLEPVIAHMQSALAAQFGVSAKTISAEYLNGLELGEEFEADKQIAQLTWTLSKFCVVKPKSTTPPKQTDAANFVCP